MVNLPAISEKDKGDFKFGCEQGVDMIFASFVRKLADVEEMRKELGEKGKDILIISKVTMQGCDRGEVIVMRDHWHSLHNVHVEPQL